MIGQQGFTVSDTLPPVGLGLRLTALHSVVLLILSFKKNKKHLCMYGRMARAHGLSKF